MSASVVVVRTASSKLRAFLGTHGRGNLAVAISICKRCGRFVGAEVSHQDDDLAEIPWFLTQTRCARCLSRSRVETFLRLPLPALIGLMAFGGFGLVLSSF